jgi:hypothetical protein
MVLWLTTYITSDFAKQFVVPSEDTLHTARTLYEFFTNINLSNFENPFNLHIEAAKDSKGDLYEDVRIKVSSQFIKGGHLFLGDGNIFIDMTPYTSFLKQQLDRNIL